MWKETVTLNEILPMVKLIVVIILVFPVSPIIVFCIRNLILRFNSNPFRFPYYYMHFDVSGKRNVDIRDYVDRFLNNEYNWNEILDHEDELYQWEDDCEKYIETHRFKKKRRAQYEAVKDYSHTYVFACARDQTRYTQQNYFRRSYKASVVDISERYDFEWLCERHEKLAAIGHEATLNEYATGNQRKLMTRALRQKIMRRDNYTCQMCGKYMPDEVGLQIDHIVPVSRGGKTIASNLRVLCNKCNAKKGSKYDYEM